ncbi:MAG: HD domain-containing protein [Deltaproteobacteria bacterium]|nr:HD domain-containing protein [Deltaproteobacteria bacterium]
MSQPAAKIVPLPSFFDELVRKGAKVYEVGGTVRDALLGRLVKGGSPEGDSPLGGSPKDKDLLVTRLPMAELTSLLQRHGSVITVGRSFGVLKFTPRGTDECYDLALPRKEVSTGQGHRDFLVDFDPNLPVEKDLERRDFTINAMACDLQTGQRIDPFGGQKDLEEKKLRIVAPRAFEEDPLRLLRGIQFAARFHLELTPETEKAMTQAAPLIRTVSAERIVEEVRKLFLAEKPSLGFKLMLQVGLLKEVFPELQECVGVEQGNKFRNDDVFEHTLRVLDASRKDNAIPTSGDLELMFSALFHDIGKPRTKRYIPEKERIAFYGHQTVGRKMAQKWMQRMKISILGVDPGRIASLVENHMFQTKSYFTDRSIRRFISKVGADLIFKLVDLRLADNRGGKYPEGIKGVLKLRKRIADEVSKKPPLGPRDLAITGHDIISLGIPEGPQIGNIQKALVEIVLDNPEKNSKEQLIEIIQTQLL